MRAWYTDRCAYIIYKQLCLHHIQIFMFAWFTESYRCNTTSYVKTLVTDIAPVRAKYWGMYMLCFQWLHCSGVSNHQHLDCLFSLLSRHTSKKISNLRVTGLCEGDPPVTGRFPSQRAANAENISIWWRHHVIYVQPWSLLCYLQHCLKFNQVITTLWIQQPWASCQIRKIAGAHAPGMPGTFSLSPHVSDPDMHYGTCVTHVPGCMPGSLTSGFLRNRRQGKTFPAFPAHAQPAILRIW